MSSESSDRVGFNRKKSLTQVEETSSSYTDSDQWGIDPNGPDWGLDAKVIVEEVNEGESSYSNTGSKKSKEVINKISKEQILQSKHLMVTKVRRPS